MFSNQFDRRLKQRSKTETEGQNTYYFGRDGKDIHGVLETYLFLPRSIGINHKTYPTSLFYENLKSAFLLKLAPTSLSGLAGNISPPIRILKEAAEQLAAAQNDQTLADLEIRHRLFGRLASETIASFLAKTRQRSTKDARVLSARYFLQHAPALCRRLREAYHPELADVDRYKAAFCSNDEHLSLLLEQASYQLVELLNKKCSSDDCAIEINGLMDFARAQADYRVCQHYPSVASSKRNFEDLVSRISTLENHMKSVLYLSARNKPDSAVTRELILSAAAGIAMIFATAVAFLAHVQYENWTTTFFIILVISYMFKDRIKAQAQTYLTHRSKRYFYDFKTDIYGLTNARAIGYKREMISFLKPHDVDREVQQSRNRGVYEYGSIEARDEIVLCYKRLNYFDMSRLTDCYAGFAVDGITSVSGFDFSRFCQRMEDAKVSVYLPEGEYASKTAGRRVYKLHIVFRATGQEKTHIAHDCVVMNRSGIKRIERC